MVLAVANCRQMGLKVAKGFMIILTQMHFLCLVPEKRMAYKSFFGHDDML